MANLASTPKGTRDFSPVVMLRRNYIFDTIRKVFQLHGYRPLETPAMENLSTLLGKYGEEGDKLLFRILNSGDFMKTAGNHDRTSAELADKITQKGLRYDLTVPFARYVVQHNNDITFPFKRYQIQPVWRADNPQKGRYREFYQCDADIVGSNSLINEAELINIVYKVFTRLKINVSIKLNNRKILAAISEITGHPDKITELTVAIDKLDKIGEERVMAELETKGFTNENLEMLKPLFHLSGDNSAKLKTLENFLRDNDTGKAGLEELKQALAYCEALQEGMPVEIDVTLARGLNYYTGAIIEVKAQDIAIGSLSGGGRYDDLTGVFGLKGVSGVGISFGADRIYDVMEQLDLFPEDSGEDIRVLFINFGGGEELKSLAYVQQLRARNVPSEIYPDPVKMKKQFAYANKRAAPFTAIVGQEELNSGKIALKNMKTGNQSLVTIEELFEVVQ